MSETALDRYQNIVSTLDLGTHGLNFTKFYACINISKIISKFMTLLSSEERVTVMNN